MQLARGVDIQPTEAAEALGGLHVIVTARSGLSNDIDVQSENRAARSGHQGSVQYYISPEDDLFALSHDPDVKTAVIEYTSRSRRSSTTKPTRRLTQTRRLTPSRRLTCDPSSSPDTPRPGSRPGRRRSRPGSRRRIRGPTRPGRRRRRRPGSLRWLTGGRPTTSSPTSSTGGSQLTVCCLSRPPRCCGSCMSSRSTPGKRV